jgi:hypothetical protein
VRRLSLTVRCNKCDWDFTGEEIKETELAYHQHKKEEHGRKKKKEEEEEEESAQITVLGLIALVIWIVGALTWVGYFIRSMLLPKWGS